MLLYLRSLTNIIMFSFDFLAMMKVIYAGIVVASGLADLTTWLLFGFVVGIIFFLMKT